MMLGIEFVRSQAFAIPEKLCELIAAGIWPSASATWQEVNRQFLHPILGKNAAHVLSSDDDFIMLMKPPFQTIADEIEDGNDFWMTLTNVGEIDYEKAVIIADFGPGSDSPIILYYESPSPTVMYLKWTGNGGSIQHSWVETHRSFQDFADAVGLRPDGS